MEADLSPDELMRTHLHNLGLVIDKLITVAHYSHSDRIDHCNQREWLSNIPPQKKQDYLSCLLGREIKTKIETKIKPIVVTRQENLVKYMGGESWIIESRAPVFIGIGQKNHLGLGMSLEWSTGVPTIPASAIKGMLRSWMEQTMLCGDEAKVDELELDAEEVGCLYAAIFGLESDASYEGAAGEVIFMDALLTHNTMLEGEIVNPHYSDYYSDPDGTIAPADWQTPVPASLLAIPENTRFSLAIAPRIREASPLIPLVKEWLTLALRDLGIGAKTAAGYGRFEIFR